MRLLRIFFMSSLVLLYTSVSVIFAKAPTTPKILFTSARDGNYEVYIMNPDGSEQVNLTQHHAHDLSAVWSSTGEKIVFVSDRGGARDLYLMEPDGSNVRRVFKSETEDWRMHPTWSPNDKQIAYERINRRELTVMLYIVFLGEQEEVPMRRGSAPAWSPDGSEIACIIKERLAFVDVGTQNLKQLLPKEATPWQRHPSWSATGDKLAFSWNKEPLPPLVQGEHVPKAWLTTETIYIVNRDGTGLRQLVDEAGPYAQYPGLSPDGEDALYTQEIEGRLQIFKVNVNSGLQTQLTHSVGLFQANFGGDWFDPAYALPVSPQPQLLTTTWGKLKQK